MRPKLILLASLVVAISAALGWFLLARYVLDVPVFLKNNWFYAQAAGLILLINLPSVFVYRRTSRRRELQAFITSALTLVLIFAFLFALNFAFL